MSERKRNTNEGYFEKKEKKEQDIKISHDRGNLFK